MNVIIIAILAFLFLSTIIFFFSTSYQGKTSNYSNLLEELANEHQGKLCSLDSGYSAVELPLSFGTMRVGVWNRSMLGTSRTNPRANISIQPTSFQDIPEFIINSKFALSCGGVYGFKEARFTESYLDKSFDQKWCIFLRPEISSQQVNIFLKQLQPVLTKLNHHALSPQWNIVNISCQGEKIDFVYSKPIYDTDSLEILMAASAEFVQTLIRI
jgi:hypothetical protein